jgi:hypothetical protein
VLTRAASQFLQVPDEHAGSVHLRAALGAEDLQDRDPGDPFQFDIIVGTRLRRDGSPARLMPKVVPDVVLRAFLGIAQREVRLMKGLNRTESPVSWLSG